MNRADRDAIKARTDAAFALGESLIAVYEATKQMPLDDIQNIIRSFNERGTDHEDGAAADQFVIAILETIKEIRS